MFWVFGRFFLKQKTGIFPTDTLEDVPERHSNDDIHCKVKKKKIKFKHVIQSSLLKNYSHPATLKLISLN